MCFGAEIVRPSPERLNTADAPYAQHQAEDPADVASKPAKKEKWYFRPLRHNRHHDQTTITAISTNIPPSHALIGSEQREAHIAPLSSPTAASLECHSSPRTLVRELKRVAKKCARRPRTTPLKNEIHLLLGQQNFVNCTDQQYADLERTLRLLSRIFELPALIKHLVIMTEGELRGDTEPHGAAVPTEFAELEALVDSDGKPAVPNLSRYPTKEQEICDDRMKARAADILAEIHSKGLIKFKFKAQEEGRRGRTRSYPGEHRCRRTLIEINISDLAKIQELSRKRSTASSFKSWDLEAYELKLADTLLHEIFHAVDNVYSFHRQGAHMADHRETFCGDSPFAECGYAAENAVFGGTISVLGLPKERVWLDLAKWPSESIHQLYMENGLKMGSRASYELPEEQHSIIHGGFYKKIQTEEYWQHEVPKVGQSPLPMGVISVPRPKEKTLSTPSTRWEDAAKIDPTVDKHSLCIVEEVAKQAVLKGALALKLARQGMVVES